MKRLLAVLTFLALTTIVPTPAPAGLTAFYLDSSLGSIGRGFTGVFSPNEEATFTVRNDETKYFLEFAIQDWVAPEEYWWTIEFETPSDEPFVTGQTYTATRWPFQQEGTAGLDFSGNGRGNNTLTGVFQILDLQWNPDNTVASAAINFVQFDEGHAEWWNRGEIRYNSDVPMTTVPEPTSGMLILASAGALAGFRMLRRRCTM